jgi:hypothetical protein
MHTESDTVHANWQGPKAQYEQRDTKSAAERISGHDEDNGSVDRNWVMTTAERRASAQGLVVRSASLGRKTDKEKSDPGCGHEVHETNSSARSSRAEKSKLTADPAGAVHEK